MRRGALEASMWLISPRGLWPVRQANAPNSRRRFYRRNAAVRWNEQLIKGDSEGPIVGLCGIALCNREGQKVLELYYALLRVETGRNTALQLANRVSLLPLQCMAYFQLPTRRSSRFYAAKSRRILLGKRERNASETQAKSVRRELQAEKLNLFQLFSFSAREMQA